MLESEIFHFDNNFFKYCTDYNFQAGITVFAVGVGDDYKLEEVQVIASDPDNNYVIQALNFDIIELKRRGLVKVLIDLCFSLVAKVIFL